VRAISTVTSNACPIDLTDVDTDLIIPKQYLKRVERTGFGPFAFAERRYLDDGTPDPSFPMNDPAHAGAEVLLSGRNFGCGSSREHAPWALEDAGFRAIIAPSFADIFRINCGKVGLLAVQLEPAAVRRLFDRVAADPALEVTVDLEQKEVRADGFAAPFPIDEATRERLLHGLDQINLTLSHLEAIETHERRRPAWMPSLDRQR
jgi:3-isopropylmalate/(R)-2-methylmalate dehydratase small subunit